MDDKCCDDRRSMLHRVLDAVLKWLAAQSVSTIVLLLVIWLVVYVIKVLVPEHIALIQAGYDRNEAVHASHVKQITDAYTKQVEQVTTEHTKQIERLTEQQTLQVKYIVDNFRQTLDAMKRAN